MNTVSFRDIILQQAELEQEQIQPRPVPTTTRMRRPQRRSPRCLPRQCRHRLRSRLTSTMETKWVLIIIASGSSMEKFRRYSTIWKRVRLCCPHGSVLLLPPSLLSSCPSQSTALLPPSTLSPCPSESTASGLETKWLLMIIALYQIKCRKWTPQVRNLEVSSTRQYNLKKRESHNQCCPRLGCDGHSVLLVASLHIAAISFGHWKQNKTIVTD